MNPVEDRLILGIVFFLGRPSHRLVEFRLSVSEGPPGLERVVGHRRGSLWVHRRRRGLLAVLHLDGLGSTGVRPGAGRLHL